MIRFSDADIHSPLKGRKVLKEHLQELFRREGFTLRSLQYVFCSDPYLLQINRDFLKHDYYTDIVTFELGEDPEVIEGEIYISIDRVRENARDLTVPFQQELLRVIFHGALHLCGYKDKTPAQQKQMRAKEDENLRLADVPRRTVS
ncbi:rRNA maturation RNase YbeY [Dinghuibacter silviterrae]|uniref:Endoribonuclease YbeY n=1 Tax=Dinghuibacter silviterrae TaxID=1539049 RepID=A0A4R8DQM2_9BACT|nr:rRNA maturation RNase YbeY [Dinghuibacter silviterrae]TDW99704.1 rRNA maturation RNase YbeY [Dinghuibacter silviterrae]